VLEGGSLQEDAELQDKWANLLANAADPRQGVPVSPVFAEVLKMRIPMMPITQSDLMPISAERSDAGLSQCERVIDISQEVFGFSLCANMTETSCVTAISEQGGKEKTQHGNDKRFCSTRDTGNGRIGIDIGGHYGRAHRAASESGGGGSRQTPQIHRRI
jgi:hypothetical protein